ncbi:sulfotransferase [Mangrovimonas sp. DI 80]|uniref:sulfotransferase family protein n=1 Tax=Mangrovimonas sp. DI 80 TaxID=1779330 RepID=UPI0009770103|nr:sulfotransferase [Mangrovimonas sp. DI 80]OMP31786.1 hypothetical protein BKM32_01620 [Mangrovimonas sp. DI 80]
MSKIIPKPNFLIVGSAKCGTTTLASILDLHPDCCMSSPKEVSFFQDTINHKKNDNYNLGWSWYQKAFTHYNDEKVIGEATPSYSDRRYSPNTAKRIFEFNGAIKIIYMVRNPLERQMSSWKMLYTWGIKNIYPGFKPAAWALKGFEFWLENQRDAGQWDICNYEYQIGAYREFFSEEQIHVTFLEDWKQSQKDEVNKVLDFLGLEKNLTEQAIFKKENTGDRTHDILGNVKKLIYKTGVHKVIPNPIKSYLGAKTIKEITYPEIDFSSDIVREFQNYIKTDSEAFLKTYNKPIDFWKL